MQILERKTSMDFKNVPVQYRPIPFWSWNEKLETEQTRAQIGQMDEAGLGGFFMHARGGLQTAYMGQEWFDNVTAAVEKAEETGMRAWAYDENGWPSGFGDGAVNGLGVAYQQKYLRMEDAPSHPETAICQCGKHWFYYDVNPFYVDTLDKKVIAKFIEVSYAPYYEKYGNRIEGFFTDEPQISRNGIPWSFVFEEAYNERYGENILECLEQLFLPVGDYQNTRVKFWKMVTELFTESYMKQIYLWCEQRGLKLTGHLTNEDHLESQITSHGACMPNYEYFHIPGMDWLGRDIWNTTTIYQLTSAAQQLGKKAVLSETFALCGHNVSFAELKGIYEWQMVRGVNMLCPHLQGYSIRGIRKRDYPPAMYVQQPWWEEYRRFVDAMSRVGMILQEGENPVQVLLLHPQTTVWSLFDGSSQKEIWELNARLYEIMNLLEAKHISFHFGDETLMQRHGKVENGRLVIGNCSYQYVIDPGCQILLDSTKELLQAFTQAGGRMVTAEELPANEIVDHPQITYTKRYLEDSVVRYFVNTSPERKQANFAIKGKKIDIYTGELQPFSGTHEFEPWGSLLLVEDHTAPVKQEELPASFLRPEGDLRIVGGTENCLTLDYCDYYFDGVLQEKNGYVLNIAERANSMERPVQIHQEYVVRADYVPNKMYLVCETPDKFRISINGVPVEPKIAGEFLDYSFPKLDISGYLTVGENRICMDCEFGQSAEFYENRRKAQIFESELNKLAYDMEIEAIYLLGDFSVGTPGAWTPLEGSAVRYQGEFILQKPKKTVPAENLEQQGYPFFCGKLCLEGSLDIQGENPVLLFKRKGINAIKVEIAGKEQTLLTDDRLPLAPFGQKGLTTVRYTLINNLRNLLGPHHLPQGESLCVTPRQFFKEPCVWNNGSVQSWDENYCFVEFGF